MPGDSFDFIAGTSAGAIFGTMLALGRSVAEITETCRKTGPVISGAEGLVQGFLRAFSRRTGARSA